MNVFSLYLPCYGRKVQSLENVVCYRKDNPAGPQFQSSPSEMQQLLYLARAHLKIIWPLYFISWRKIPNISWPKDLLNKCLSNCADHFNAMLSPWSKLIFCFEKQETFSKKCKVNTSCLWKLLHIFQIITARFGRELSLCGFSTPMDSMKSLHDLQQYIVINVQWQNRFVFQNALDL